MSLQRTEQQVADQTKLNPDKPMDSNNNNNNNNNNRNSSDRSNKSNASGQVFRLRCDKLRGFIATASLFSHDSTLLFLFCDSKIYIHSVSTSKCICVLTGHKHKIVNLVMNPLNMFQLISLDTSGVIKIWDYLLQKCIKTIEIFKKHNNDDKNDIFAQYFDYVQRTGSHSIECSALVAPKCSNDSMDAPQMSSAAITVNGFLSPHINGFESQLNTSNNSNSSSSSNVNLNKCVYCLIDNIHVVRINLETSKIDPIIWNVKQRKNRYDDSDTISNLALTSNGLHLSVVLARELIIISLKEKNRLVSYHTGGWYLAACLCFHPSNKSLAFGDVSGKIHVWNDFQSLFEQRLTRGSNGKGKGRFRGDDSRVRSLEEWLTKPERAKSDTAAANNTTSTNEEEEDTKMPEMSGSNNNNKSNKSSNNNNSKNKFNNSSSNRSNTPRRGKRGHQGIAHKRVGQESEYLMRRYHWHAHKAKCVGFTTDGAYMLSGGEESVLLMTQLETNRHHHLPRLGGAIRHIAVSPDEVKFAVCLDSNVVRIIDAVNNKTLRTIEGISLLHKIAPRFERLLQRVSCDPRDGQSIVLPALPGSIQFYDLQNDCSRGILEVVKYPLISRTQQKEPDRHVAEFMVLNRDGTRLVTVVRRSCRSILGISSNGTDNDNKNKSKNKNNNNHNANDADASKQTENTVALVTLQIYHFNRKHGVFVLNTRIDSPHGTNPIRGVRFHPVKNRFLTFAQDDVTFRIWEEYFVSKQMRPSSLDSVIKSHNSGGEGHIKRATWRSKMSGYYRTDAVSCADFSSDGSILFVCAKNVVTLWNAETLMLLNTLSNGPESSPSHDIAALSALRENGLNNQRACVLTLDDTHSCLNVWDLTTFRCVWSISKASCGIQRIHDFAVLPNHLHPSQRRCVVVVAQMAPHARKASNASNVVKSGQRNKNELYLIVCDIDAKLIEQKWILPADVKEIELNSLVVQPHRNQRRLRMTGKEEQKDWKDVDIVVIGRERLLRVPCLFLQFKAAQGQDGSKLEGVEEMEQKDSKGEILEYLKGLNENKSMFEKLFGADGLDANRRGKKKSTQSQALEMMDAKELINARRRRQVLLNKLQPKGRKQASVVDEMFDGPVHTLPSLDSMFGQYMAYFVPTKTASLGNGMGSGQGRNEFDARLMSSMKELNEINESNGSKQDVGVMHPTVTTTSKIAVQVQDKKDIVLTEKDEKKEMTEQEDEVVKVKKWDNREYTSLIQLLKNPDNEMVFT